MDKVDNAIMGGCGGAFSRAQRGPGSVLMSRKGFNFRVGPIRARPSNTFIRDLLPDDLYTEAVLVFQEQRGCEVSKFQDGSLIVILPLPAAIPRTPA